MTPCLRRWLGALAACVLGSVVAAAEAEQIIFPGKPAPVAAPEGGGLGHFTLVAALVLAAGGAWLLWRGKRLGTRNAGGHNLVIAETRSLGNRQFLVVATYEDKKFLLGICPDRIALLAPLHEEKTRP